MARCSIYEALAVLESFLIGLDVDRNCIVQQFLGALGAIVECKGPKSHSDRLRYLSAKISPHYQSNNIKTKTRRFRTKIKYHKHICLFLLHDVLSCRLRPSSTRETKQFLHRIVVRLVDEGSGQPRPYMPATMDAGIPMRSQCLADENKASVVAWHEERVGEFRIPYLHICNSLLERSSCDDLYNHVWL